jgi:hypothetical protein
MDDSGGAVDPGCAVVGAAGVVVAGTPAGGVSPADGVVDNEVDGAAGEVGAGPTCGVVDKVVVGAESLGLGEAGADDRACANAVVGSSKSAMVAKTGSLGVNIAITMALPAVPLTW